MPGYICGVSDTKHSKTFHKISESSKPFQNMQKNQTLSNKSKHIRHTIVHVGKPTNLHFSFLSFKRHSKRFFQSCLDKNEWFQMPASRLIRTPSHEDPSLSKEDIIDKFLTLSMPLHRYVPFYVYLLILHELLKLGPCFWEKPFFSKAWSNENKESRLIIWMI